MAKAPDVRTKFAGTDFDTQNVLLLDSISMAILFPRGDLLARQAIDLLRRSHGKKRHDIPPRMYVYWVDSLMTTLHEVEPKFDSELERLWRGLLQITIDYMSDGYEADS